METNRKIDENAIQNKHRRQSLLVVKDRYVSMHELSRDLSNAKPENSTMPIIEKKLSLQEIFISSIKSRSMSNFLDNTKDVVEKKIFSQKPAAIDVSSPYYFIEFMLNLLRKKLPNLSK